MSTKCKQDYYDIDDNNDEYENDVIFANGGKSQKFEVDLSLLEALEKSQSQNNNTFKVVDLKTLKKLVLSFERKPKDNIEAHLKYRNQPDRFTNSKINLHDDLHKLSILIGAPKLYLDLINLNAIPSILNLLAYDNTDIVVDVFQLLQDLIDPNV